MVTKNDNRIIVMKYLIFIIVITRNIFFFL